MIAVNVIMKKSWTQLKLQKILSLKIMKSWYDNKGYVRYGSIRAVLRWKYTILTIKMNTACMHK